MRKQVKVSVKQMKQNIETKGSKKTQIKLKRGIISMHGERGENRVKNY